MSDVDLVDFKQDVRINESTRVKRSLVSFGTNEELDSVSANIIVFGGLKFFLILIKFFFF